MARTSRGWPKGDRASNLSDVGALASRTAVMACCSLRRCSWMSAIVLRSENSRQRAVRRSMARWVSGSIGLRGGTRALAQPASSRRPRKTTLRSCLRPLTLDSPETLPEIVYLLLDAGGGRVQLQRLLPGSEGLLVTTGLGVGVA